MVTFPLRQKHLCRLRRPRLLPQREIDFDDVLIFFFFSWQLQCNGREREVMGFIAERKIPE
jgi:hypothetical protein